MRKIAFLLVHLLSSLILFSQTHLFKSISFTEGGEIHQCAFAPTNLTMNGYNYVSFPGFGTTHSTAAYGDHVHTLACYWLANGTSLYYNAGNIGIGLSNPSNKLEVIGNSRFSSSTTPLTVSSSGGSSYYGIFAENTVSGGTAICGSGASIGTSKGVYGIGYYGVYGASGFPGGYGGYFANAQTNGVGVFSSAFYPGIFMGGNVGINITNPSRKLDVNGDIYGTSVTGGSVLLTGSEIRTAATDMTLWASTNGNTSGSLVIKTNGGSSFPSAERMRVTGPGKVGIGISNPTQLLEVAGTTKTNALMVGPYYVSVTADCSIPQSLSGLLTDVTATLPIESTGGTTPNISMSAASLDLDGYLTKEDWFSFNERVMSVYTEPPLQCSGGLNPSIQMQRSSATVNGYLHKDDFNIFSTRAAKNSSGYLHMDDFDNFNSKVSSQWNNNTGYIDYGAGNVAIKGKDPTHTLEVTGTFKVYDYKSTSDFVTQIRANAGSAFMSGVYTNGTIPGINGSYLYNHSVYADANGGSYFYYYDHTQNYNYRVGIFDGTGIRKSFCGLVGGAGGVVDLGTSAIPWGKGFFSGDLNTAKIICNGVDNTGNITTTGFLGIGTTAPTAIISAENSTSATNINLNSTYPIQSGTNTQTIAQINMSHISNATCYARTVLRYDRDNSRYEFLQTLFSNGATRAFQYVNMLTGGYEMRGGVSTATFYNTGNVSYGTAGGFFGIGTLTPTVKFHISSVGLATNMFFARNNKGAANDSSVTIGPRGFIGVGTTNPTSPIHAFNPVAGTSIMLEGTWPNNSQKSLGACYFKNSSTGDYGGMMMRRQAGNTNEYLFTTYNASTATWCEFIFFDQASKALTLGRSTNQTVLQPIGGPVGINITDPTDALDVGASTIRIRDERTIEGPSSEGFKGQICWDKDFIYICIEDNVWQRVQHTSW
jgi:hypothetical protein